MATTPKLIAKIELGSSAASVTFGSGGTIPQTYTDLLLEISARSDISDYGSWATLNPNGATTNISGRSLYASGSTPASTSYSSGNVGYVWTNAALQTSSTFSNTSVYIPNYAGSTNKSWSVTAIAESNSATQNFMAIAAFVWASTDAITSITLDPQGAGNFVSGSTFYLYGITKA